MKIYLAGTSLKEMADIYSLAKTYTPEVSCRFLLSYFYFQRVPLDEQIAQYFPGEYLDIFADSGAYSAMTQGTPIIRDAYATWIQKYKTLFSHYANLDVVRNAQATKANQTYLEQEYGLAPLPVFHVAEPFSMLSWYLERYPLICLGVAGFRYPAYTSWMIRCFQMKTPLTRFHGFGITAWKMMQGFPWYSVDSSSWSYPKRGNNFHYFDQERKELRKQYIGNFRSEMERMRCYEYGASFRTLGLDPEHLMSHTRESERYAMSISLHAFWQAERYLEQQWGSVL